MRVAATLPELSEWTLIHIISTKKSTAFFFKNNDIYPQHIECSHQIFYIPCFLHIWYDTGLNILHLYYHKYIKIKYACKSSFCF